MGEEPVVFHHISYGIQGILNADPISFADGGNQIERCQPHSHEGAHSGAHHRHEGLFNQSRGQRDSCEQIGGHDSQRSVAQPDSRHDERQRRGRAVEGALPEIARGISPPQGKKKEQRDPEASRQLRKIIALIDGEQRVAEENCGTTGQSRRPIVECLAGQCASSQTGCGKQQNEHDEGNKIPRQEHSQYGSAHPTEGGIKDKFRLARSEIRAIGPVRVEDAHRHAVLGIDPGNEVEAEVATARGAAQEERRYGDNSGKKNDGRPRQTTRTRQEALCSL